MAEAEAKTPNRRQRRSAAKADPVATEQAQANYAIAAKALADIGQDTPEALKDLAEKCGGYAVDVYSWQPFGGAKSFAEYDTFRQSLQMGSDFDDLQYTLRSIMDNILADGSLSDGQKGTAITAAAAEFTTRADVIRKGKGADADIAGKKDAPTIDVGNFTAYKSADGWRWFAVYSNRYYDKTKEVFPEAAHKAFVENVDKGLYPLPELWDWHTPFVMGKADMVDYQDGLAMAWGYFHPEYSDAAQRLSEIKDLGVSHGYHYHPSDPGPDGAYSAYQAFEISPLPRAKAANEITLFLPDGRVKEEIMQFSPEKRAHLVKIHGEEAVKGLESRVGTMAKDLEGSGIGFKEIGEMLAGTPTSSPSAAAPDAAAQATTVPPAAAEASAGGTKEETPAAAPAPAEGMKALQDLIAAAVKSAVEPLQTQVATLESTLGELAPNAAKAMAAVPPSMRTDNVVNGNNAGVKEMKAGDQAQPGAEGGNIPDFLQYYLNPAAAQAAAAAAS